MVSWSLIYTLLITKDVFFDQGFSELVDSFLRDRFCVVMKGSRFI